MEQDQEEYGKELKEDGSCVRGLYYAFRLLFILVIIGIICFGLGKVCFGYESGKEVARNAKETASWYGVTGDNCDPWKHTTTANGEKFNENAMTAASWKYALGSKVKVTNLRNGKSIIVRINDRGPSKRLYRKGRVIDLTRGSFAKVAPLRDGVIPIKIEVLGLI